MGGEDIIRGYRRAHDSIVAFAAHPTIGDWITGWQTKRLRRSGLATLTMLGAVKIFRKDKRNRPMLDLKTRQRGWATFAFISD